MRTLLTQSGNYKLYGDFEEAQLEGPGIVGHIVVGDFYGSADCGCIDKNEQWCVSGGNGIVIYRIKEPFINYQFDYKTDQWRELFREPKDKDWYPEVIYQIEDNIVRMVIDIFGEARGVYDLNIETLEMRKQI